MNHLLSQIVNNPQALVGLSAFLATFVASVMADEQDARLRQGTFGAIAGVSTGGLAAILQKDGMLLLVGVFGSASGAIIGWIVYLGFSMLATRKWARTLIEYHVAGLKGVQARVDLQDQRLLLKALSVWSQNFRGMVLREFQVIMAGQAARDFSQWVAIAVRGWLTSLVDAFNLVLDALAEKSEYRSRVTIIVFGKRQDGQVVGRHWIAYAGDRQGHKQKDLDATSVAYKVLIGDLNSPYFTSLKSANQSAQNREDNQNRPDAKPNSYGSFYVFRLNDHSVLSLDWPNEIEEEDEYIRIASRLLYLDVAPAIGKLLDSYKEPLAREVGLEEWAIATRGAVAAPAPAIVAPVIAPVPAPAPAPAQANAGSGGNAHNNKRPSFRF